MSASASGVSPRAGASDGLRDEASAVFTLVAVGARLRRAAARNAL